MTKNNAIVPGSLSYISKQTGQALAESFLSCDVILICDTSGSMNANDAPKGLTRYRAAEEELARLQREMPGKIAVISFSDYAVFCPSGIPDRLGGGTDMAKALSFVHPADDTGVRFILISDGQPNDEQETLQAASRFKSKIDTIYIGPENDLMGGRKFLQRLAAATGGKSLKSDQIGMLKAPVEKLLLER